MAIASPQTPASMNRRIAGGKATAAGMNFQATVSALVAVNILTGKPLRWLETLTRDVPTSVSGETGGPGDDLMIELSNGETCEIQVKRGLKAGGDLWSSITKLATGLERKACSFGVLVVCPLASQVIRGDLAKDLRRIGDGRADNLSRIGTQLLNHLRPLTDVESVTQRLRIVTVSGVPDQNTDVSHAKCELDAILLDPNQTDAAWDRLCKDASTVIESGGRRTTLSLLGVLASAGISVRASATGPAASIARIREAQIQASRDFSVLGFSKPLPIEGAWLPLVAEVVKNAQTTGALADVVAQYHGDNRREEGNDLHAATIGLFIRHGVVVGGPGLGKSTLLKRLALSYSKMGLPVLRVRLQEVAIRMKQMGATFLEALLALGTEPPSLDIKLFSSWAELEPVILCDGLDECDGMQERVAEALKDFGASNPRARIIVTTRPVGYHTTLLSGWRHYRLQPLEWSYVTLHVRSLLEAAFPVDGVLVDAAYEFATDQLKHSGVRSLATRTPLILGLCASLAIKRVPFGESKTELYRQLFKVIRDLPIARPEPPFLSPRIADAVVDYWGLVTVSSPLLLRDAQADLVAELLSREFAQSVPSSKIEIDRYLEYWENRGLLETLSHGGEKVVTFIHRSFGEFAAARALMRIADTDVSITRIKDQVRNHSWNPVLDFVAGLGGWRLVRDAAWRHRADFDFPRILAQVAKAGTEAPGGLTRDEFATVVESALPFLSSPVRSIASEVGHALWRVGAGHSSVVTPHLEDLADHVFPWTKLIGWNLRLLDPQGGIDREALGRIFLNLPQLAHPINHGISTESGRLVLGRDDFSDVVSTFVCSALPQVIALGVDLAKLGEVILSDLGLSTDDVFRVDEILKRANLGDLRVRIRNRYLPNIDLNSWLPKSRAAHLNVLGALQNVLPSHSESMAIIESGEELYHLAAFFSGTNYLGSGGREGLAELDVTSPSVLEVLRGVVAASGLEPATLSAEVTALRRALVLEEAKDSPSSCFYSVLSLVDAEIDWERIRKMPLDDCLLEATFSTESKWLIQLAANALFVRLADSDIEPFVARVMSEYSGVALWVAAVFCTEKLSKSRAAELLVERIRRGSSAPGLQYLAMGAAEVTDPDSELALVLVEAGLLRHGPLTAKRIASFVDSRMPWSQQLETIVRRGYERWQRDEDPYPKGGGRIPESPRETLLRVLHRHVTFSLEELILQSSDPRGDVSGLARDKLVEHLQESADSRTQFAEGVISGGIEPELVIRVLKTSQPWTEHEAAKMCTKLASGSEDAKRTAIALIEQGHVPIDLAERILLTLSCDDSFSVKQKALRIIEQRPESKSLPVDTWGADQS